MSRSLTSALLVLPRYSPRLPHVQPPKSVIKPFRYLLVLLLTTGALLLAASMPAQQIQPLFFLYLGVAMVGGWYAGWKSGILITLLSAFGLFYLLLPPLHQSAFESTREFVRFTVFAVTTLIACWSLAGLHFSQAALRNSNAKLDRAVRTLQTLIETMPMGVVAVDAETGRVMLSNTEGGPIAGVRANLKYEPGATKAEGPLPAGPVAVALARALQQGETVDDVEFTVKLDSANEKTVLLGAAPIHDCKGKIVGAVATFKDITALKRAERSLMINEKLVATGRLAAAIAHEINNPMSSVMNLLFLLQGHHALDENAREMVKVAQAEVLRMSHIVKQMLAFYRESGSPTPVRVSGMLDELLRLYAGRVHTRNITVETEYKFAGEIVAHVGELRQSFSNLILNAVESIPNGGKIHVRVSSSRLWNPSGTPRVRVTIADTGTGIRQEHRHRIFEPFFTTKGEKGTGLGLWVADGIVRKHGGSIRLHTRSAPRRSGTCVSIFLPIESVQKRARGSSAAQLEEGGGIA